LGQAWNSSIEISSSLRETKFRLCRLYRAGEVRGAPWTVRFATTTIHWRRRITLCATTDFSPGNF
jgi:hypothetical protein